MHKRNKGFTIVELLIVIVVIGILAAISIVSYTGVSQKADSAVLKSDLTNIARQIEIFKSEHETYPTRIDDCPIPSSTNICIKLSSGISLIEYQTTDGDNYNLTLRKNNTYVAKDENSETREITNFKKSITIDRTKVGNGGVSNFPVYVNLANMGADFFNNIKSDGGDIRITESDKITYLPIDLVSIDKTNQKGELWFKANSISSATNTVFYIHYGNQTSTLLSPSSTLGSKNVWTNYDIISHSQDPIIDSSNSNYTMSISSSNLTSVSDRFGNLNSAKLLDNQNIKYKIQANNSSSIGEVGDKSYSIWINPTSLTISNTYIYDHYNWRFVLNNTGSSHLSVGRMTDSAGPTFDTNSTSNISIGNWYKLKGVYHPDPAGGNGYIKYYINGVLQNTTSISNLEIWVNYGISNLQIGNSFHGSAMPFNGIIDDFDVYNGVQNDAYILTEYNNQSNPVGFYTVGPQE